MVRKRIHVLSRSLEIRGVPQLCVVVDVSSLGLLVILVARALEVYLVVLEDVAQVHVVILAEVVVPLSATCVRSGSAGGNGGSSHH